MASDKVFSALEASFQQGLLAAQAWRGAQIQRRVYDVTEFLPEHPGGKKILLKACGQDSSEQFWQFHSKKILTKTAAPMKIGTVGATAKL